ASSLGYDISYLKMQPKNIGNYDLFVGSYYFDTRRFLSKKIVINKINLGLLRNDLGQFYGNHIYIEKFKAKPKSNKGKKLIIKNDLFYDISVEGEYFLINGGIVSHNSGGYVPYSTAKGAPLGKFAPGTPQPSTGAFRVGNWQPGQGKYFMKPKKPIEGINYIEINAIKLTMQIER
ncbi:unnamed protein product, partial [marine sediment metagenome]